MDNYEKYTRIINGKCMATDGLTIWAVNDIEQTIHEVFTLMLTKELTLWEAQEVCRLVGKRYHDNMQTWNRRNKEADDMWRDAYISFNDAVTDIIKANGYNSGKETPHDKVGTESQSRAVGD